MKLLGLIFLASVSFANEPVSIANKAYTCSLCHGFDGTTSEPDFPNLVGQNSEYLFRSSMDYVNGLRTGEGAELMRVMLSPLSEQDIAEIAKFYSELP